VCIRGHPFMTCSRTGWGSGSDGRMRTGEGSAPCGRPHRKLEPNDVVVEFHLKVRKVKQVCKLILSKFFLHRFRLSFCIPTRWVEKCRAFSSSTYGLFIRWKSKKITQKRVRVKCRMQDAENQQRVKCGKYSAEYSAFYPLCRVRVSAPISVLCHRSPPKPLWAVFSIIAPGDW